MAARKKYANKKTGATRNNESSSSTLKRLIIISLVGLFGAFLVYLDTMPGIDEQTTNNNKKSANKVVAKKAEIKKEKYKFDFYTELSEREVETYKIEEEPFVTKKPIITKSAKTIPIEKVSTAKKVLKPVVVQPTEMNMLYQLQVGAFSDWSRADAMKGRLALLGVEPNIQVFHANGQKMYRVRIGPMSDAARIERIKKQLKTQNINAFMQKIKV